MQCGNRREREVSSSKKVIEVRHVGGTGGHFEAGFSAVEIPNGHLHLEVGCAAGRSAASNTDFVISHWIMTGLPNLHAGIIQIFC